MDKFMNIVESDTGKQVKWIDSRYYEKNGKYFPGISTILNVVSKGSQYETWLKSNGFNADYLAREAMNRGSKVHEGIQLLLEGQELIFGTIEKGAFYSRDEWRLINKFVDFYITFKPETVAIEKVLVSEKLGFGSQLDYVCLIGGVRWLIDHKTGNLYDSAKMQVSAYKQLWNEYYPEQPINKVGVMHLESTHRGRDSKGKEMQGIGWKLVEVEETDKHYEDFTHVLAMWNRQNPNYKPFNEEYPAQIKLINA